MRMRATALVAIVALTLVATAVPGGGQPPGDTLGLVETDVMPANVDIAVAVSQATFDTAARVLVSRDDGFADALASGTLQDDAPLLLTPTAGPVPAEVAAEITRLGATEAIVLGGPAAVSGEVITELAGMGLSVSRRQGPTRIETATTVAATDAPAATTALLARAYPSAGGPPSQAFADTLAAGGIAAREGYPVLLTESGRLTPATATYLASSAITHVIVLGGTAAISEAVEAELGALGLTVQRVSGPTRVETAVAIAGIAGETSAADVERVIVTDGQAEDAWAAGFALASHAAAFDAPILLTLGSLVPQTTVDFLADGIGGDPDAAAVLTCAVVPDVCESARIAAQLPPQPPVASGSFAVIEAGSHHTCAVATDGTAWCWGVNVSGQLGTGDTTAQPAPAQVRRADTGQPLTGVVAISAGMDYRTITGLEGHSCAALTDGTAWCWGHNDRGQLGDGQPAPDPENDFEQREDRYRAVPVVRALPPDEPLTDVVDVGAGMFHSCAVRGDGTAWCWGDNQSGQLGIGVVSAYPEPTDQAEALQVLRADTGEPLNDVTGIAVGQAHTCAVRGDGTAWCWGDGWTGQLGNGGTATYPWAVQVKVGDAQPLTGVVDVAAGSRHSCCATADGSAWCFGDNFLGQLGTGETDSAEPEPYAVQVTAADTELALTGVVDVTVGDSHSCAADRDGRAWCWGNNTHGSLGSGDFTRQSRAVPVLRGTDPILPLTGVTAVSGGQEHTCAVASGGSGWCWGPNLEGQLGTGDYFGSGGVALPVTDPQATAASS